MGEIVPACPECDTTDIQKRTGNNQRGSPPSIGDPEHAYRCRQCSATFDSPDMRERKKEVGASAKYADLKPGDLGLRSGVPEDV